MDRAEVEGCGGASAILSGPILRAEVPTHTYVRFRAAWWTRHDTSKKTKTPNSSMYGYGSGDERTKRNRKIASAQRMKVSLCFFPSRLLSAPSPPTLLHLHIISVTIIYIPVTTIFTSDEWNGGWIQRKKETLWFMFVVAFRIPPFPGPPASRPSPCRLVRIPA